MMNLGSLIGVPLVGALAAALDPRRGRRLAYLVVAAAAHLALLGFAWIGSESGSSALWLAFDPLGGLVLTLVSVVFLSVAVYSIGYLRHQAPRGGRAYEPCLLVFLAAASAVCLTDHFGVLWVAMEATTLATAPLIYDPEDRHSIEAVWKYLLICSVGIALALLGTFMLAMAQGVAGYAPSLSRSALLAGPVLDPVWFKAAFVFLFVGYGTKVGLVPMHTWLPDAHGEAPSPISALLSGALLNCAFLAVLRVVQVSHAGGQERTLAPVLVAFGLASMLAAAALLLKQQNYKRMLAYSSIEHMGILTIGVGIGQGATYGALLHLLGSSMCKALLFFVAGNVLIEFGSKRIADVAGVLRRLPASGLLLVLGFLALVGVPPSGLFVSEVLLLRGAIQAHQAWVAAAMLVLQTVIFVGLVTRITAMAQGAHAAAPVRERIWLVLPPAGLLFLVVVLGTYLSPSLREVLVAAADSLGGTRP